MTAPDNTRLLMVVAAWIAVLGLPLTVVGLVGLDESIRGWVGPVVLAVSCYGVLLLLLFAARPVALPAVAWVCLTGGLVGQLLLRGGLAWPSASGRWALAMALPIVAALLVGSESPRAFLAARESWSAAIAWLVFACAFVSAVITGVLVTGEGVVDRIVVAVSPGPHPIAPGEAAVRAPSDRVRPRFPRAHSVCVARLTKDTPAQGGVSDAAWTKVLLIAVSVSEWEPCWVGIIDKGPDGLLAVKLVTRDGGPEAAIVVREADGRVLGTFVKPQAGQLYYQQPGGEPLVNWDLPGDDVPCGTGRLVIFRDARGSISGFSHWSRPVDTTTRGTMSAFYTPADIGLALITRLERVNRPLPTAVGSVVEEGGVRRQFYRGFSVTSADEATGSLTADRLLARCAA